MKIDISVNIVRGDRPGSTRSGWEVEAMRLIKEAHAAAYHPGLPVDQRDLRLRWLGGAIKIFAVATGRNAEELRAELGGREHVAVSAPPVPTPPATDASSLPMSAIGTVTPPAARVNRPPRHPGAQRPVEDRPDLPADMFDGLPGFAAVGEAVLAAESDGPSTQVTVHAPEVRRDDEGPS